MENLKMFSSADLKQKQWKAEEEMVKWAALMREEASGITYGEHLEDIKN